MLNTFFGGNLESAVETLLSEAETDLTDEQVARLSALIDQAAAAIQPVTVAPNQTDICLI